MKNAQLTLDQLEIHPQNVRARTAYDEDGLAVLAANIEAFGLLQPLVVQALETKGRYGVVAGGRRLGALKRLAEAGTDGLDKLPCRVLPKDAAVTPASLSENAMQEVMSPIEEFEAFVAMVDEGRAIDNIALVFGTTVRSVKERLRFGRVHADIRAEARQGAITLDAMKAFAQHPCQETQKRVFEDLKAKGRLQEWMIRQTLNDADMRADHPLGQFVAKEYEAASGEIVPALFPEETVFKDRDLVEKLGLKKLGGIAAGIAAEHGFSWSDAALAVDYSELSRYGRIYPETLELDEAAAERLDVIAERLDALSEMIDEEEDADARANLTGEHDALEKETEALQPERYDPEAAAKAGVIVSFEHGRVNVHAGLVRPEDKADATSGSASRSESNPDLSEGAGEESHAGTIEEDAPEEKAFVLSRTLVADLGVERADAVAVALHSQPALGHDALLFAVIRKAISLGGYMSNIELQCHPADRGHSRPEARDGETLEALDEAHQALDLSWCDATLSEGEKFLAFRELAPAMKKSLAAWCMGMIVSPRLVEEEQARSGFVQTLAAEALPDIRTAWRPTAANYWSRVTKAHMLDVLRSFGMEAEAREQASARKTTIADYMEKLFARPFATLAPEQHAAIAAWAPEGMATSDALPDEEDIAAETVAA